MYWIRVTTASVVERTSVDVRTTVGGVGVMVTVTVGVLHAVVMVWGGSTRVCVMVRVAITAKGGGGKRE